MGLVGVIITDRDKEILKLVYRMGFCLGRHIKFLLGFSGSRSCDRRLTVLIQAGYLNRKKYLYGIPYLYTLPYKGRILIGANKRENKIRLDQITHDIYVIDVLIYYRDKYNLGLNEITSERELHIKDGFGARKHHPDFVFIKDGKSFAVEVELTTKSKARLENNIRDNYIKYDNQVWLTNDNKAYSIIKKLADEYSKIAVLRLEEIDVRN